MNRLMLSTRKILVSGMNYQSREEFLDLTEEVFGVRGDFGSAVLGGEGTRRADLGPL